MLINLRNALMAGKRLPYDAEVEYLQSSGTQWIDTGYSFNSATDKVELVFELLTTTPNYKWIFGAYDTKRFAIGSGDSTDRRTFGYNASTSYNSSTYYTNGAHNFLADSTGASIDGHSFFGFADFSTTSHIILYSIPIDTSTYCSNSRIWSYKHYRNGVLVRDFIPVRVGTVGYLYDRVSGKLFGNAGTGDFVLGQDVVPVEYLQSSGTQYINSGLTTSSTLRVVGRFKTEGVCWLFGGRSGGNNKQFSVYQQASSNMRFGYNNTSADKTISLDEHEVDFDQNVAKVDGNTLHTFTAATFSSPSPLYIGTLSINEQGAPATQCLNGRIYYCKVYVAGTLVRDYIPVRVGTEGAMMDVLTRRIYRNAGTGAFAYGNDLKYPIPSE